MFTDCLRFLLFRNEIQGDGFQPGAQAGVLDTGGIQHPLGSLGDGGIGILIRQIIYLFYTGLDDRFGAGGNGGGGSSNWGDPVEPCLESASERAVFFQATQDFGTSAAVYMWIKGSETNLLGAWPGQRATHLGGGTLGYENPRKTFLNFRNNLLMLYKNLPRCHRWWIMLVRFGMDYMAALQMLLTGQKENVKAVVKARLAYHKMKKEYLPTHDNKMRGFRLLARRSIVWDFYVRKKSV